MPAIRTVTLPDEPTYISPAGVAEIRLLLQFPAGELTHARVQPGSTSKTAWVHPCSEWYYVLGGHGNVWIADTGKSARADIPGVTADHDGVSVSLVPRRSVRIPPGAPFRYHASGDQPLNFLVAAMPQWRPEYHHAMEDAAELPDAAATSSSIPDPGVVVYDAAAAKTYEAPDHSRVTLLGSEANGGLAICELGPGQVSLPVRHRTVEELWYVVAGEGQISRRQNHFDPFVDRLAPGVSVDIGTGLTFQFRCTSNEPLEMLLLTMPEWPGADEAIVCPELATWPAPAQ